MRLLTDRLAVGLKIFDRFRWRGASKVNPDLVSEMKGKPTEK